MRVFSTLDLLTAHDWTHALFTTYSLSLSFFESVVLDALVRQRVESSRIFADLDGVRGALSEYGARSAGRLYDVEPVAVTAGCFHPKLTVLVSAAEAHVVIGSGNLTFGGWGSNLECAEHLHAGFAADAIEDVASFLEAFAVTKRAKHVGATACFEVASRLRKVASGGHRSGQIRVIHNLDRSLFEQVEEAVAELRGAQRLAVVSPFYDDSAADTLRARLGLEDVALHVHEAGTVRGTTGSSWPFPQPPSVRAVTAEWAQEPEPRALHAKVFEVLCRRGRILISGSANATCAAWSGNRNVELCVVRTQIATADKWILVPTGCPQAQTPQDAPEAVPEHTEGILRAAMEAGQVQGLILTPFPAENVRILRVSAAGHVDVGETSVDEQGHFHFPAGNLELQGWSNERFLLRISSKDGHSASGFVSFPELTEIRTRLGGASSSFFNLLLGTETPRDVAAIMDWFFEHPTEISPKPMIAAAAAGGTQTGGTIVEVSTLFKPPVVSSDVFRMSTNSGQAWGRFLESVLQCFREQRGSMIEGIERDEGEADSETEQQSEPTDSAELRRPLSAFERLLEVLLNASPSKVDIGLALRITNYVCDRLDVDALTVGHFLNRLVDALTKYPPKESDEAIAKASVLLWAAQLNHQSDRSLARTTRSVLLRMGLAPSGEMPDPQLVHGFVRQLRPNVNFSELWSKACTLRVPQEDIRAYRTEPGIQLVESAFPALSNTAEWPALKKARRQDVYFLRKYTDVCPKCFQRIPTASAYQLKINGITTHCGKMLLCEEL